MGEAWTDDEIEYLRENWGDETAWHIAQELDRSRSSVRMKAHRLGIRT